MGERVAAGSEKENERCEVAAMPQPHRSFEHRGTECVPPITEGRTVKINAGFTSGQRVQKVLSFLMTDKTVNMYLENFIQISD